MQVTAFSTVQPTFSDPGLETVLEQQGVVVNATSLDQTTPWWLNLLLGFGPTILLIGGFVWLTNRASQAAGGGPFGIGRSRAKRYDEAQDLSKRITFDDVAGIDEAKGELVEIVDFLKDSRKYTRLGGTVPKGVLLVGQLQPAALAPSQQEKVRSERAEPRKPSQVRRRMSLGREARERQRE